MAYSPARKASFTTRIHQAWKRSWWVHYFQFWLTRS